MNRRGGDEPRARWKGTSIAEVRGDGGDVSGAGVFATKRSPSRDRIVDERGRRTDAERQRRDETSRNVDVVLEDSFPASDPPSWPGGISRVRDTPHRVHHLEPLLRRVRAEYQEMPGLSLTLSQAQRLWSLERRTCEALLRTLIDSQFLRRTDRGLFVRCTSRA